MEGQEMQNSAAPPAFQLMASAGGAPIQRQQAPVTTEGGATPPTHTQRLQELWAAEDKAPFWAYIHANRAALGTDREATTWLDQNMSFIGNWRADTVIARGAYARWTPAQMTALATEVRNRFPAIADIRRFVESEFLTNDFKLQKLGILTSQILQAEYILGTMFHRGASWESTGSNSGPSVDLYHDRTGFTWAHDAWCTMFVGYAQLLVGFRRAIGRGGAMWSNPRLRSWHQDNRDYTQPNREIESPSDYANYSGSSIDRRAWLTLRTALEGHYNTRHADEAARAASLSNVFTTFFAGRATPQPGDIVILNNANTRNTNAENHTIMVEQYDADTHTIHTVEGNSNNRARGRQIRLEENPTTGTSTNVGHMSLLVRPGLEFYRENPDAAGEGGHTVSPDASESDIQAATEQANTVVAGLQAIVTELRTMAQSEGAVGAGTTVAAMSNPNNEAGTTR